MLQSSTEQKSRCFRVFPCTTACCFHPRCETGQVRTRAWLFCRYVSLCHIQTAKALAAVLLLSSSSTLGPRQLHQGDVPQNCCSDQKVLVATIQYFHFLGKLPATSENGPGPPPEPEDSPPPFPLYPSLPLLS